MAQPPYPRLTTVEEFAAKWNSRMNTITDPAMRELIVDLVNVVWQIEASALEADAEAHRAKSRATWGLMGGW